MIVRHLLVLIAFVDLETENMERFVYFFKGFYSRNIRKAVKYFCVIKIARFFSKFPYS